MAVLLRGLVDREDASIECERIFELVNRQWGVVGSVGLGLLSEDDTTALSAWSMARSELSRCRSSGIWSTTVPLETLRVRSVG